MEMEVVNIFMVCCWIREGHGVVLERGRGRSWLGLLLGRRRTRSAWRSRWGGEAAADCGRDEPRLVYCT